MCGLTNEQLISRIQAGENEKENMLQLWQQNKGLIYKMAKKYSEYAEMEDLQQEAYIGLCAAVKHYDIEKGVLFASYAGFWIKQSMQRYVDNCSGAIRLPVHAREWIVEYNKINGKYRQYYGCEPSDCELCHLLGVTHKKLQAIRESARMGRIESLNEVISGEAENFTLEDTIVSDENIEADAAKRVDTAAMKKALWGAVDRLPAEQSRLVRQRYQDRMSLKETSERIGVSYDRARQIEYQAIAKLRLRKYNTGYREYFEEYLAAAPAPPHVGVERFKQTWTSEVEQEVMRKLCLQ